MKVKTSITLSGDVIQQIDQLQGEFQSRSEFLERAARLFLAQLARAEADRQDLELINRHAEELNGEARDVLAYQVTL